MSALPSFKQPLLALSGQAPSGGIALANKMARSVWAMLTKNESYQGSALAAA